MKVLIAYSSRQGTTAKCAKMLRDMLGSAEVECVDINKNTPPSPENYDVVVLGSSVRYGGVSKNVKKYIKAHKQALNAMPSAVFLCCGYPDRFEEYVKDQFKRDFKPTYDFHCFGGELKPKQTKGIDRLIVSMVRRSILEHDFEDSSYEGSLPEILPESISILADTILKRR